jgi:hypothetical protein
MKFICRCISGLRVWYFITAGKKIQAAICLQGICKVRKIVCFVIHSKDGIDIDISVNCNRVDTRWQYTFTHKQYIEHHN